MKSFELAFRMQMAAPEATDLSSETETTRKLDGMDDPRTESFARECIMARRLAERGVRFIQVSHAHSLKFNNEQWDQHSHLEKGHSLNVGQIDKPITRLILDLKARGLLEILWSSGEVRWVAPRRPSRAMAPWAEITIRTASRCGWRAQEFEAEFATDARMSLVTMRSKTGAPSMISMQLSSIFSASITES